MVTCKEIFKKGLDTLLENGIENAEFDCGILFEKAFGVSFNSFKFSQDYEKEADKKKSEEFFEMINKRCEGYPLQYIAEEWEFFGMPFKVGEGVLIPRQDTETLVEFLISRFKGKRGISVCDLCAGSGCIGIALEKNLNCENVTCVEFSDSAIKYLEENKILNNSNVKIVRGDVLNEDFVKTMGQFDLIVSNPPYLTKEDMEALQKEVTFEPEMALYGGDDGLDFYRGIVRLWKNNLKDGGMLAFEIGMGQEDEVSYMMIHSELKNVRFKADLCGVNRIVYGENIFLEND